MSLNGTCLCGKITVTIEDESLNDADAYHGHLCHCQNCRTWGGCLVSSIFKLPLTSVKIQGEEYLKSYHDSNTLSGNTIERKFCSNCGSSILKLTPRSPDSVDVHTGLFRKILQPSMEGFCKSKQDWEENVTWPVKHHWVDLPGGAEVEK